MSDTISLVTCVAKRKKITERVYKDNSSQFVSEWFALLVFYYLAIYPDIPLLSLQLHSSKSLNIYLWINKHTQRYIYMSWSMIRFCGKWSGPDCPCHPWMIYNFQRWFSIYIFADIFHIRWESLFIINDDHDINHFDNNDAHNND